MRVSVCTHKGRSSLAKPGPCPCLVLDGKWFREGFIMLFLGAKQYVSMGYGAHKGRVLQFVSSSSPVTL